MKTIYTTFLLALLPFLSFANCKYESFVLGEEFSIGNMLEWTTAQEVGIFQFLVEKSDDGVEFHQIGTVEAVGHATKKANYRFMDLDARKGRSFYRLKHLDIQGGFNYSPTLAVNKNTENNFRVISINNPINSGLIDLTIDVVKDLELSYTVMDMKGSVLNQSKLDAESGLHDFVLDIRDYPMGIYQLKLESAGEVETVTLHNNEMLTTRPQSVAQKN